MRSVGWPGMRLRGEWFEVGGAAVGRGGMRKKCDLDAEPRPKMHAVSCEVAGALTSKLGPCTRYTLGS